MKINYIGPDRDLLELTVDEVYNRAGIYDSDSEFEKDCKFLDWIGTRKHRCIEFNVASYSAELEKAAADGIEILIIKEKHNVTKS